MFEPNFPPLSLKGTRVSVRDLAYQALRDACVRGLLVPGQILSEEQLASLLDVSRTPLREAIQRLHVEGLIERAGNGRIYVREVSYEDAQQLYSVRSALEQLAVQEAVDNLTAQNLERLRQSLERMQRAEGTGEDVADSGGDFHEMIREIAGNPVNDRIIGNLQVLIDRYRHLSTGFTATRRHEAVREHEAIFIAMARKDKTAATELMRLHLEHSKRSVLQALSAKPFFHRDKEIPQSTPDTKSPGKR